MNISSLGRGLLDQSDSELYQKIRELRKLRRQLEVVVPKKQKTDKIKKQSDTNINKMNVTEKKVLLDKLIKLRENRKR